MRKIHHDSRDYDVANSEAAKWAREKFARILAEGRSTAAATVEHVVDNVPQDQILNTRVAKFKVDPETGELSVAYNDADRPVHDWAARQIYDRVKVPAKYAEHLQANADRRELLAHTLNHLYHREPRRQLVRSVHGEIRGWLSDRYRRLDSRPILEAFIQEVQSIGAVPLSGIATDLRWSLKAALDHVFEPVKDEVMVFGLELRHSDFAHGPLALATFGLRVKCTNLWSAEEAMRQVHLGKRLPDNVKFSERTYRLDTETQISAMRDVVRGALSPEAIARTCNTIREASELDMTWDQAKKLLGSLTKDETEKVKESFEGPDVLNLPEGKTRWRLSNAVSWLAVGTENKERKLDLERAAGALVAA